MIPNPGFSVAAAGSPVDSLSFVSSTLQILLSTKRDADRLASARICACFPLFSMVILHDPRCADYGSSMRPEQPARVTRTAAHLQARHSDWSWRVPADGIATD